MNRYVLELENDVLLNIRPLIKFLKENENKDIFIQVNQESHDLRATGVYDIVEMFTFNSVTVNTANAIESHPHYLIDNGYWYHWLNDIYGFNFTEDYHWNQSKIFGCFYGRPSASRLGISSYLHNKYKNQSLIKVRFNTSNEDNRKHFELQKIYSWDSNLLPVASFLNSIEEYQSEFHAYSYQTFEYDFSNPINYLYKNIFIDLVVEAHLVGDSFYPTEKLSRAILCQKPFIAMAPVHYLRYLRQTGFRTFGQFWDESYDDLGEKERYLAVLKLIDYFGKLTPLELVNLNMQIQDITKHNYQLLINNKYNKKVRKI